MSKNKKLRKKINAFVNQLTPDEIREQLVLAYMQMERCLKVLKGECVEPVPMEDNGLSSDLELFYACKKNAEELKYLNGIVSKKDSKRITFDLDINCDEAMEKIKAVSNCFNHFMNDSAIKMKYFPNQKAVEFSGLKDLDAFAIDVDVLKKFIKKECDGDKGFKIDIGKTPVYFLSKGRIHKNIVDEIMGLDANTGDPIFKIKGYPCVFSPKQIFVSPDRLVRHIGEIVSQHKSCYPNIDTAFFIDKTNRVFEAAWWYLEEREIEHFKTLDDLRAFLLVNIVDDLQ